MKTLKKYILFSSILSLMLGAQALLVQIYMIQVYSRVIPSNNVDTLVAITIIIIFFLTLFSLIDYMRRYVLARGAVKLESELAGSVMLAGLRDEQQKMGDDFGLLREVSSLRAALTSAGFVALFDIVFLPLYLALLFYLHPLLGSVTLAGAVALLIIALANRWITALALQKHAEAANRSSLSALSQLSNAELIRAHGMYRETLRLWGSHYAESLTTYLRATNQSNLFDAASKAVRILIQIALLGFGGFLVIDGHMSAGIIFATSILGSRTLAPIEQVIGGWKALGQGLRAYTKVQEKLASNPETFPKMKLPRIEGRLDVEKLVYGFPGTEPILKGISLSVAPGNMIAIVGSNGGGKSTLARLMVGAIRPTAGAVRLDSNELSNWNPLELGPLIGYMPQSIDFIQGTVAENIGRFRTREPDFHEKVVEVAKLVNAHHLISSFPDGYETVLGPSKFQPSGGQKQLIALARAFYGNPRFIVLDEPNASLDQAGDDAFIKAIVAAKARGATVVVITQRPNVLQVVDAILVLKGGRIESFGPRNEMLSRLIKPVSNITSSAS